MEYITDNKTVGRVRGIPYICYRFTFYCKMISINFSVTHVLCVKTHLLHRFFRWFHDQLTIPTTWWYEHGVSSKFVDSVP